MLTQLDVIKSWVKSLFSFKKETVVSKSTIVFFTHTQTVVYDFVYNISVILRRFIHNPKHTRITKA